jgi:hypothetical protein
MRMTEAFSRPAMVDRYIALVSTAEQTTTTQHSDAPREAGLADKAFRAS